MGEEELGHRRSQATWREGVDSAKAAKLCDAPGRRVLLLDLMLERCSLSPFLSPSRRRVVCAISFEFIHGIFPGAVLRLSTLCPL